MTSWSNYSKWDKFDADAEGEETIKSAKQCIQKVNPISIKQKDISFKQKNPIPLKQMDPLPQFSKKLPFFPNFTQHNSQYFALNQKVNIIQKTKHSSKQIMIASTKQIPRDQECYLLFFIPVRLTGSLMLGIISEKQLQKETLYNQSGCIIFDMKERKSYQNGEFTRLMTQEMKQAIIDEKTGIQMEILLSKGSIGFYNSKDQVLGQSLISPNFSVNQKIYPFIAIQNIGDSFMFYSGPAKNS